jgi:hypothetical protein
VDVRVCRLLVAVASAGRTGWIWGRGVVGDREQLDRRAVAVAAVAGDPAAKVSSVVSAARYLA